MVSNNRYHWVRKVNRRKNIGSHACVELHFLEFSWRQFARLIQYVLRDGEFSHVVEKSGSFNSLDEPLISYADLAGQPSCVELDTSDMTMCDLIFGINGHCEGFDCREIELVKF